MECCGGFRYFVIPATEYRPVSQLFFEKCAGRTLKCAGRWRSYFYLEKLFIPQLIGRFHKRGFSDKLSCHLIIDMSKYHLKGWLILSLCVFVKLIKSQE